MKPIYIFGQKRIRELEEQLGKLQDDRDHYRELYHESESKRIEIGREVYGLEKSLNNAESCIRELGEKNRDLLETIENLTKALDMNTDLLMEKQLQHRDSKGRFIKKK